MVKAMKSSSPRQRAREQSMRDVLLLALGAAAWLLTELVFGWRWYAALSFAWGIVIVVGVSIRPREIRPSLADEEALRDALRARAAPAPSALPPGIALLARDLVRFGRPDGPAGSSRFLHGARADARAIGELLHERGGQEAMLTAHAHVRAELGADAARELELSWDGIGEWRG